MAITALDRGDERNQALRETVTEMMQLDEPRKRHFAKMAGLDIHYDLARDIPCSAVACPISSSTPRAAGSVCSRCCTRPIRCCSSSVLPVVGEVSPPTAALIGPDGYVAWVGEGTDEGLREALPPGSGCPFCASPNTGCPCVPY